MSDRTPITTHEAATDLAFQSSDTTSLIVQASEHGRCEIVLDDVYPQSNQNFLEYLSVYGARASQVLTDLIDSSRVQDARVVTADASGSLIECIVSNPPHFVDTVADARAVPRSVSANAGIGNVVAAVPPGGAPGRVIQVFRNRHRDATLAGRREHNADLFSEPVFRQRVLAELTEKQQTALETAYREGYFDQPRRTTAEECAEALGVSQSTFSQHLRVSLRKVLTALLADASDGPSNAE